MLAGIVQPRRADPRAKRSRGCGALFDNAADAFVAEGERLRRTGRKGGAIANMEVGVADARSFQFHEEFVAQALEFLARSTRS